MKKNPLISVIVPCYNVEKYVVECLKSIVEQSYENLEIIVVNDGSTDNTEREILPFLEDERVKYIVQENQGLSGARNAGLDNISGEYVCLIDSDDFIHPDFVKTLYQNLTEYDVDIAFCDAYRSNEKIYFDEVGQEENITIFTRDEVMQEIGKTPNTIVVWNKLYKKNIFNKLRFELGRIHEDEFFTHRAFWQTQKVVFNHRKLYYHRQIEGSIMNSNYTDKKLKDAIDALNDRIVFYKNHNIPNANRFNYVKWHWCIYNRGILLYDLDYAKSYIIAHPYEFYKSVMIRKKDKIKLYLKLLKEKFQK